MYDYEELDENYEEMEEPADEVHLPISLERKLMYNEICLTRREDFVKRKDHVARKCFCMHSNIYDSWE